MSEVLITRFAYFDDRVIGRFQYQDLNLWSVERPWRNNRPYESCIPEGDYTILKTNSPKFGDDMWLVADVPDRSHILIHVGNKSRDVVGCIAIGQGLYAGLDGVSSSRLAIDQFYEATAHLDSLPLHISKGPLNPI